MEKLNSYHTADVFGWFFWLIVLTIGISNVVLVHPVPGIVFLILSFVFFPPADSWLRQRMNFGIPRFLKIALGFMIIWFTLGISDLGEIMGF